MGFSILERNRLDRYEFEIFIGEVNFTGFNEELENCDANNKNVLDESGSKKKYQVKSIPTIKELLDNISQLNISNYDKIEEDPEDQCSTYYDDFESNKSLTDIVKSLTERNPLELIIREDLQDSQIQLGTVSVMLSSSLGFTSAICSHFFEKGYDPYAHTVENEYEVKNMDGSQTIRDMFVRLKLTCHGPETMQVNQIVLKSNEPKLQPIFTDSDPFGFHLKKPIKSPPTMMYDNISKCMGKIQVFNPEIRELLDFQRTQEVKENKSCVFPCKGLIGNVETILFDGTKRFDVSMCKSNLEVNQACSSVKTRGSVNSAKVENCNDCNTEKKSI
ncbi:uncharacterized protein LOC100571136 [Acyrthosiphon pisum]|uniref:Uncharacterized protein n=1 Tax=Acyrthosiphon pisum TaxID=7029 RepID=A0A8R2JM92_ACYPI|nr:uncharacterized protein LOC100571136 [Acyrthosiphon pisum]